MKSILVPTDFSDCAGFASKLAIQLAKRTGAEIHFLHLLSVPTDWIYLMDYAEKMYPDIHNKVKKANVALSELVLQAERMGVTASRYLSYDESHSEILEHLEKWGNDFIVMGTHGASGFKEFFMGSLSQKIARQAPVPVLVVKNPVYDSNFHDIVFTSDFEREAIPQFLEVVDFCKKVEGRLHLVYINSPTYFADSDTINRKIKDFTALCPELIASVDTFSYYSLDGGFVRFCEHLNPDLVALIVHGRKPLFNNLVDHALNYSGKPVLCISKEVVNKPESLAYQLH